MAESVTSQEQNCMNDKPSFFDTNILVYAFDEAEPLKREKCEKHVLQVFNGQTKGIVSNQILAELFFVLTQRVRKPLDTENAARIILSILNSNNWIKLNYSVETVAKAAKLTAEKRTPFWDALIAETMLENQVFSIITENKKDFEKI